MAETKTNIPFQVKMGTEKDSSGASKLPSFEEGSLIITTDTKKVYVDPIDSDERIAVGGTEVVVDTALSTTSTNPVQNKAITAALNNRQEKITSETTLTFADGKIGIVRLPTGGGEVDLYASDPRILTIENGDLEDSIVRGVGTPSENNDAANKQYVDSKTDADITVTSGSSKLITSDAVYGALSDKQDNLKLKNSSTADYGVTINPASTSAQIFNIGMTNSVISMDGPAKSISLTAGSTNLFIDDSTGISVNYKKITGVIAPTDDTDVANKKYVESKLTQAVGTTSYSSADSELYLPTGSNMVIPNTLVGRIFIGPDTDTPNSPDFKIYVNDVIDDGKLIITSLKTPSNDEDAANKKYVDDATSTKQDKFATVTTKDTVQTVKIGDNLSIVTSPNFGYSQISSSKILVLAGSDSTNSYVSLRMSKLENSCDFDATQGYLRVRDTPLADDFAVNKKYVDDIKTELLNAITHPYTYDETTKELTLIL